MALTEALPLVLPFPSEMLDLSSIMLDTIDVSCMTSLPILKGPEIMAAPGIFDNKPVLSELEMQLEKINIDFEVEKVPQNFNVAEFIESKINSKNLEDPFYVVDLGLIRQKLFEWREQLPRVEPFYAIKCNPHPAILRTLKSYGLGFDCASKVEMKTIVEDLNVHPSKVIYANPCKPPSHLQYARDQGVDLMTFDNMAELVKIKKNHPKAKVILRLLTDDSSSICRFGTKFGAPPQHIPHLLQKVKTLGLDLVGLSFHVGSGCLSTQAFVDAVKYAHHVFQQAREFDIHMDLLDIGGGFPGATDTFPHPSFNDIAAALRPVLDDLFPTDLGVRLIAEPGRYFAAESHALAVCVYARRDVNLELKELHLEKLSEETSPEDESMEQPDFLYYVNDGVYGSFNCIFFDHAKVTPLTLKPVAPGTPLTRSTIFGPTCDSMDCISKNALLPEIEVGDWLYFKEMGAYTCSAASKFNGFEHPGVFFVDSIGRINPG